MTKISLGPGTRGVNSWMLPGLEPGHYHDRARRLADAVRTAIEDGTLRQGQRLPQLRQIAHRYDTTATTVYRALETLVTSGHLTHVPRCGFYVTGRTDGRP